MRRSSIVTSPVLTFLTRNPDASRRTHSLLCSLFNLENIPLDSLPSPPDAPNDDPPFSSWQSLASQCPTSGTVIHIMSIESKLQFIEPAASTHNLSLLSISNTVSGETDDPNNIALAVKDARRSVTSHLDAVSGTVIAVRNALGFPIAENISKQTNGIIMEFPLKSPIETRMQSTDAMGGSDVTVPNHGIYLRELALPFSGSSSLQSKISQSGLTRPPNRHTQKPMVGLYRWDKNAACGSDGDGLILRPIPGAQNDMTLSPPCLVFQFPSLEVANKKIEEEGATSAKVGFSGDGSTGQLRIHHELLMGIDIRACQSKNLSSTFSESDESLLAGSLQDLQGSSVLSEGGSSKGGDMSLSAVKVDKRTGMGDCWVEFRANIKHPSGFFRKLSDALSTVRKGGKSPQRVAKSPDLPYE